MPVPAQSIGDRHDGVTVHLTDMLFPHMLSTHYQKPTPTHPELALFHYFLLCILINRNGYGTVSNVHTIQTLRGKVKFLTGGDRAMARQSVTRPSSSEGGGAGETPAPTVTVWMGEAIWVGVHCPIRSALFNH